jgi:fumarate hydratase class II
MATPLAPEIGYEAAAKIAKKAYQQGKTIEEVVSEEKILDPKRVKEVLDPWKMTSPD